MKSPLTTSLAVALLVGASLTACTSNPSSVAQTPGQPAAPAATKAPALEAVYQGDTPWMGIAVSDAGRAFVLYPRPEGEAGLRVAELKDGRPVAYPSATF